MNLNVESMIEKLSLVFKDKKSSELFVINFDMDKDEVFDVLQKHPVVNLVGFFAGSKVQNEFKESIKRFAQDTMVRVLEAIAPNLSMTISPLAEDKVLINFTNDNAKIPLIEFSVSTFLKAIAGAAIKEKYDKVNYTYEDKTTHKTVSITVKTQDE